MHIFLIKVVSKFIISKFIECVFLVEIFYVGTGSLIFILLIRHCPFVCDSYQYLQPLTPPVQQPQTTYWDSTPRAPPRLLHRLAAFSWMFSILSDQVHRPMEWIQMDWHREQKKALKSMWIVLSFSLYVCICWALCFGVICMFIVFRNLIYIK